MVEGSQEKSPLVDARKDDASTIPTKAHLQYGTQCTKSSFEIVEDDNVETPGAPKDDRLEYVQHFLIQ